MPMQTSAKQKCFWANRSWLMPQGIPTLGLKISAGKNLRCMRGGSFTPNISNDTLAQRWAEK